MSEQTQEGTGVLAVEEAALRRRAGLLRVMVDSFLRNRTALFGVVFALSAGDALAQKFALSASSSMTEGQSLVPVSVNFTAPAEAGRSQTSANVTVTVVHLTATELGAWGPRQTIAVLESMQPPITRAELGTAFDTNETTQAGNLGNSTDIEWEPSSRADIVIANGSGTATFTFTYGEGAVNLTHTAFLRTNRDSADAEDELFRLEATSDTTGVSAVSAARAAVNVRIDDAQEQTYVINFPGDNDMTIDEGMMAALELEAVPDRTVNIPFNVTLSSPADASDYWLDTNPVAIVYPSALRILRISPTAWPMARGEKGRRLATGRVSGWRRANHAKTIAVRTRNMTKIACQPPRIRSPSPSAGATVGTMMNTAIANDMSRAISRPSY